MKREDPEHRRVADRRQDPADERRTSQRTIREFVTRTLLTRS
jgi:hypothetical protein